MLEEIKTTSCRYFIDEQSRIQGKYEYWWLNGSLMTQCYFVDDQYHGEYKSWRPNGSIEVQCFYVNGKRHGKQTEWYENGIVCFQCMYTNQLAHGEFKAWDNRGKLIEHCFYVNDFKVLFDEIPYPTTPEDLVYFKLKYDLPLLDNCDC